MEQTYTGPGSKSNPIPNSGMEKTADEFLKDAADRGQRIIDSGKEIFSDVTDEAQKFTKNVAQQTGKAVTQVGEGMSNLAGTIRERSPSGVIGSATGSVADSLESSGHYLAERDLGEMTDDFTNLVRKYPVRSFLVGIGVGAIVYNAFSRKS